MKNLIKIIAVAISLIIVTIGCDDPIKQDIRVTGVTLNKDNISLTVDKTENLTATVKPNDATNQAVTWASSHPLIATVANGKVTALKAGTATISVTTTDGGYKAICEVTVTATDPTDPDDPEWIEISGIKWATRNVNAPGTFAANPESAGMFYQWTRKIGWSNTDPLVNHEGGTAWSNYFPETNYTWEVANDPCPSGWRVPTHEEQQSLVNSGYSEMTTLNGVTGRYFGNGNNKVFFPAAGFRLGTTGALADDNYGTYWSGTRENVASAYAISFNSTSAGTNSGGTPTGRSMRCVKE